jgi:hypothetical protein
VGRVGAGPDDWEATVTRERGIGVRTEDEPQRVMRAHRTLSPELCITARIESRCVRTLAILIFLIL